MRAGGLDRRIVVERATVALDGFGAAVEIWAALATVWAEVRWISDGERWRAGAVGAEAVMRVTIRAGLRVTERDRLVIDGRVHGISGVKEIGRGEGQEITAGAAVD